MKDKVTRRDFLNGTQVAIGASLAGSRALCAMKHVGLNVASDALMTDTLIGEAFRTVTGIIGGSPVHKVHDEAERLRGMFEDAK